MQQQDGGFDVDHNVPKHSGDGFAQGQVTEKDMKQRRLVYQLKRTLDAALPILLVWSLLLLLMMGAAVVRHKAGNDHPAQSQQTSKAFSGVRI